MKRTLRLLSLMAVAICPGPIKRSVYRLCFGYRIGTHVRIGVALLDCRALTVGDGCRIGHATAFVACGEVVLGRHVAIGPLNIFRGGRLIALDDYAHVLRQNVVNAIPDHDCTNNPDPVFRMGYGAALTAEHRVDFTASVTIGRHVTIGGRGSSFWTHNRRVALPISVGDYAYVGSEIRMAPGSAIPPCCIVGLGSVIVSALDRPFSLITGVPAAVRRPLVEKDAELLFGKTRKDLPDEEYPRIPVPAAQPEGPVS